MTVQCGNSGITTPFAWSENLITITKVIVPENLTTMGTTTTSE